MRRDDIQQCTRDLLLVERAKEWLFCRPLPRPFRVRQSQEEAWKRICSDQTMDKADALLRMLCEAFSFSADDRYRFAPTDHIMDVYQACYPRWHFLKIGDCMEIESLMMDLHRRFQLNDAEISEMTLAEVVELTHFGSASAKH